MHNHPSVDPFPSADDSALTKAIVEAGRLLGIDVLDYIVFGSGLYISLRDRSLWPERGGGSRLALSPG